MGKTISTLFAFAVVIILAFLLSRLVHPQESTSKIAAKVPSLPDVNFLTLHNDSVSLLNLSANKPAVIIYFSPDCEHCQHEASEIQKNINAFSNAIVMMITPFSATDARQFANNYNLNNLYNVYFLLDRSDHFYQTFGTQEFPSILIYNRQHKLVKIFIGETKIKNIINQLNNKQ
jgi:peroxiredoxin